VQEGAGAEQILDGRDELEGSSGFCRNPSAPASSAWSLASRVEMASTGAPLRCLSCRHSSRPLPGEISRSITIMLGVSSSNLRAASAVSSAAATS
jgi:hypothetical protein